ncbi:MAG: neutral/alkaline non-lysosomal ceramidase N-terminal domain-containing protein [Sandaracinaceae bacterium]|nr:neutral/alkaline non-lysosomal ceramidase N-terminal domain-containing protein [Sandaracinaceae bacterium]
MSADALHQEAGNSLRYRAGFGRTEITAYEHGMAMLGWEHPEHRVRGVATPLFARALFVEDAEHGGRMVLVVAELGYLTCAIRLGVLAALTERAKNEPALRGLGPHNVALSATHTHSGPSGLSQFPMYNTTNRGFSPPVFDAVVTGIVSAIAQAVERAEPATLRYAAARIPYHVPVAFNRSVRAFNDNHDTRPVPAARPELATARESKTLRVDDAAGRGLGLVNWFGLHGTSLHTHLDELHSDNKGIAAVAVEQRAASAPEQRDDFVAIFAQGAAGDVSPNRRWHRRRGEAIGEHDDDHASAELNGALQAEYAWQAFERAARTTPLGGAVGGRTLHLDMADAPVAARFVGERPHPPAPGAQVRTRGARLGLSMSLGTLEGPGPLHGLRPLFAAIATLRRRAAKDDPQVPLMEVGHGVRGRALGLVPYTRLARLGRFDYSMAYMSAAYAGGVLGDDPWAPRFLPLQLLSIAGLPVALLPGEPTTTAGRRVRALLRERLPHAVDAVVAGHSNGYGGYITTREEYAHQRYEGASTLFGPHTLGAYLTALDGLAQEPVAEDPEADALGPPLAPFDHARLVAQREQARARIPDALRGS